MPYACVRACMYNEACAAQKYGCTLSAYNLSSELHADMRAHHNIMTKFYRKIGKLVAAECQDRLPAHIY